MGKEDKKENVHKGHRQRVKENFLKRGLDGFQHHEIIELLLFFGIPQKDTNELAHELMKTFGSFSGVFNAHYDDLLKVKGMTGNAATLITMIPQLLQKYMSDVKDSVALDNIGTITDYFVSAYFGVKNEEIKVCCLDNHMKILSCNTVIVGGIDKARVDMRKIVEAVFRANATYVIIAHNHPNGSPVPSEADILTTKVVKDTFDSLGIVLVDHVIVGRNTAVSMKNSGYFNIF